MAAGGDEYGDGFPQWGATGGSVHGPTFWLLAGGQRAFSFFKRKSIYGLKQASRQWYLKFHEVRMTFGFKENTVDQCIYLKVSGSKFLFLVLYVDDILLASSDLGLLHDTKAFLIRNFEMKDMGEPHMSLALRFTKTSPEVSSDYLRRPKSQNS